MMPFSTGTGLERVGIVGPDLGSSLDWFAGSGRWRESTGARSLPLRCLSQFFPDEKRNQLLEGECFAYLFSME